MPTSISSTDGTAGALEVARVIRPHGIRGELKVELYWTGSESLLIGRPVRVVREGHPSRELAVEASRPHGKFALVKLSSVDDRNAAEALRGARLAVERSQLPELAQGEYYLVDLVGAEVVGPNGRIGEVEEVRAYPSVDVLVVRLDGGQLAEQPIAAPFVERIDANARLVVLTNTEGLIT